MNSYNKSDYSFLDKLTLVIPTYNRHKYLKRTIKYWSNYNVKLVLLDGSDLRFNDPCLNAKNIKYIHNTKGIYPRFLNSIKLIDTEFMMLGSDDEFYLPSAVSSCIKFLIAEPSYYSCGGRALAFGNDGKNYFGFEPYPKLKDLCLDNKNCFERIFKHFSVYVPAHIYSVMRTRNWNSICSNIFKKKYNFQSSEELQLEFLIMVSGKSKIIPQLMWIRNREVPAVAEVNPEFYFTDIYKWWFDKKNINEKFFFIKDIKKACDEILRNQSLELTENKITMLFDHYVSRPIFKKNFLKKIVNFFQIQNKKLIKFIFGREQIRYNSIIDQGKLLKSQGVLVNYEELSEIISILQNSKNN